MRETAERIGELEMALRESMNTSAHREALWAQEESARVQAQRQVYWMFYTLMEDSRDSMHIYTQSDSLMHHYTDSVAYLLKQSAGISSPKRENARNLTAPPCG